MTGDVEDGVRVVSGRSRRARAAALIAVAALALVGARAARRPIQIRIEGYLDEAPAGAPRSRVLIVQFAKGEKRTLAVSRIVNLGSGVLGATILDEAARYKPSFTLVCDAPTLQRIEAAGRGTAVKITGNLSGHRYVLVSTVELSPAPTGASPG
ncbi:MAG TPA: hypothetical protein VFD92_17965 [Candidatus Binatia bacterium]|nr:hypothetical protein [Candidatus Binatia bacterium]